MKIALQKLYHVLSNVLFLTKFHHSCYINTICFSEFEICMLASLESQSHLLIKLKSFKWNSGKHSNVKLKTLTSLRAVSLFRHKFRKCSLINWCVKVCHFNNYVLNNKSYSSILNIFWHSEQESMLCPISERNTKTRY